MRSLKIRSMKTLLAAIAVVLSACGGGSDPSNCRSESVARLAVVDGVAGPGPTLSLSASESDVSLTYRTEGTVTANFAASGHMTIDGNANQLAVGSASHTIRTHNVGPGPWLVETHFSGSAAELRDITLTVCE
jgi:hypothetical protein